MKTIRWATVATLLGASFATTGMAQSSYASSVEQPASVRPVGYQTEASGYALADGASPSNATPPAPPVASGSGSTAAAGSGSTAPEAPKDDAKKDDAPAADDGPYKLFHGPQLDCWHLDMRGFADIGYTVNGNHPINAFNGPVGYNDRDRELDLNQLYFITERVTKIENNCGTDWGGRVDLLYGTDHRFTQANPGTSWDGNWNEGSRFYGLSMPQLYGDLAYNKLLVRVGHMYAPVGYESAMGQDTPFYSRSYQFLYAEPTTFTGGEAMYNYNDNLVLNAGLDTGWNDFTAPNDKVNYYFGYAWTSKSKDTTLNQEVLLGDTQPEGTVGNRFLLNTVLTQKIGCGDTKKWRYALETNYGHDTNVAGVGAATWWGFSNYLFYDANDCWTFGIRQEYMDDSKGAVVAQVGPPAFTPVGSRYNEITLGADWKPNKNVMIRNEIRGDFAGNGQTTGLPFGGGTNNNQFLWDTDIIIRF